MKKGKIKEWLGAWNVTISIVFVVWILAILTNRESDYPIASCIWIVLMIITLWVNYYFINQKKFKK